MGKNFFFFRRVADVIGIQTYRQTDSMLGALMSVQGQRGRTGTLFFQVSDRERFHVFRLSLIPWLSRGEVGEGLGIRKPKASSQLSAWGQRKRSHRQLCWQVPSKGFCRAAPQDGTGDDQLPCLSPGRESQPQGALSLMSGMSDVTGMPYPSVCLSCLSCLSVCPSMVFLTYLLIPSNGSVFS